MKRSSIFMAILIALAVFLIVVLAADILSDKNQGGPVEEWSRSVNDTVHTSKLHVGDDDTLYFIEGKTLYAMGPQGSRWSTLLSLQEDALKKSDYWNLETVVTDQDSIYLSVYPSVGTGLNSLSQEHREIIALTRDGKVQWTRPLNQSYNLVLTLCGGRIYSYVNGDRVLAFDKNGTELWNQTGITNPPAFDEDGFMYSGSFTANFQGVTASYPNGTVSWKHSLADYSIPVTNFRAVSYDNGTVYLWTESSLVAIRRDGSLKWAKTSPEGWCSPVRGYLPDSNGYLYMGGGYVDSPLYIITRDGNETVLTENTRRIYMANNVKDGIAYGTDAFDTMYGQNAGLYDFRPVTVSACNATAGDLIWKYTLPSGQVHLEQPDGSRFNVLTYSYKQIFHTEANETPGAGWYEEEGIPQGSQITKGQTIAYVVAGNNTVYVSYWAFNYDCPFFTQKSNFTYTGGIYALNRMNGSLLWNQSTDSFVTDVVERNSTVYYHTADGKVTAVSIGIAAGLIAATGYLCFHFMVAGAVARARSRLDRNENRNRVYKLIVTRPGSTMHEIARVLAMNVGTVRYHLLILSLNHRIVPYADDTKFIRYFTNSNSYSDEEKLVISLLRRESYGRLMVTLLDSPDATNGDLAARLMLPESAVSKYLRTLYERGVVAKTTEVGEKPKYRISDRFVSVIKACCERTGVVDGLAATPDSTTVA